MPNRRFQKLETALSNILDNYALSIRTLTVGTIVSYDSATQSAKVQPSLLRQYEGEEPQPLPILEDVPVMSIGNGNWIATYELQPETSVILGICDRSIERWKARGGQLSPFSSRHHDITDAVILGVLNPFTNPVANQGSDIEIRKLDGSMRLRLTGSAVHVSDGGDPQKDFLTVNSSGIIVDGNISATGNIDADGEVTAKASAPTSVTLSGHTHPYTDDGNPATTSPPNAGT